MSDSSSARTGDQSREVSERYEQALERFTLLWSEMASNWGINRTMAQIHALLYAKGEPLDTDTIMEQLQISRGNANMNLRSLVHWNLVRKIHQPGSRKDHYEAERDVWQITTEIIKERQRRELVPVGDQLEACRKLLLREGQHCEDLPPDERLLCERIESMMQMVRVFEQFLSAFLPFLQEKHAPLLRDLIQFARALEARSESEGDGDQPPIPEPFEPTDSSDG